MFYTLARVVTALVTVAAAGLTVLLLGALLVTAARAAWWLTFDYPLAAIALVLVGVLAAGRRL